MEQDGQNINNSWSHMKVEWGSLYYSLYFCVDFKCAIMKVYFLNVYVAEQFMRVLWMTSRQTQNLDYSDPIKIL